MFLSKADTLRALASRLTSAKVLDVYTLTYHSWQRLSSICLLEIPTPTAAQPLIVRSSSFSEDTHDASNAGAYLSVLDVCDEHSLRQAIHDVFQSYGDEITPDSQVLIQPQLQHIARSGVVFTRDPNNAGYYYVLNVDESTDTQAITSGYAAEHLTEYWFKSADIMLEGWRSKLKALLDELEAHYQQPLDIEFGFDVDEQLYLFQVRPLIMKAETDISQEAVNAQLIQLGKKIAQLSKPHPHLLGETAVFANMPDWNPAEMLGTRPKPLAMSLYKELITDNVWAYQRSNYGYRNLRSFPLMVSFGCAPYIHSRVSFNSFVPQELDETSANKLVSYYLQCLNESPEKQDKVEFDIVVSCYSFDIDTRLSRLAPAGLTSTELVQLKRTLRELTNRIIDLPSGLLTSDLARLDTLQARYQAIMSSDLNDIETIYWLIEDVKRYGTLPFAGIARAGFIAKQFLDSLCAVKVMSEQRVHEFLSSIHSISSELIDDLAQLTHVDFFEKYGHLRPGTYDIESPRYDEMPELVWQDRSRSADGDTTSDEFALTQHEQQQIQALLSEHEINTTPFDLFEFMRLAMEGREFAKFLFTRNVSEVLRRIERLGKRKGFTRNELAYLDITEVMKLYASTASTTRTFDASIAKNKPYYMLCSLINLPPVIGAVDELFKFQLPCTLPNFITLSRVIAPITSDLSELLEGKIVFIPAADPGYDWIFSQGIAGLVTMYGGVNSHMAIRAGELQLPAVIGAGEMLYTHWQSGSTILIDCQAKKVDVVK